MIANNGFAIDVNVLASMWKSGFEIQHRTLSWKHRVILSLIEILHEKFDNSGLISREIDNALLSFLYPVSQYKRNGCAIQYLARELECFSKYAGASCYHDLVHIVRVRTTFDGQVGEGVILDDADWYQCVRLRLRSCMLTS